MLRTRLIVGTLLAGFAGCMLLADERFTPWYPFLFLTVTFLAAAGTYEFWLLLPEERRPLLWVVLPGVLAVVVSNWWPFARNSLSAWIGTIDGVPPRPLWHATNAFAAVTLATFIAEMARFQKPGRSVERIAVTVLIVAYLGLLPSYLVQLRLEWAFPDNALQRTLERTATFGLAFAIFVPKACDIGAYFTGRLLGRHPMAPVLSPKKTWEGLAGGLVTSVLVAYALFRLAGDAMPWQMMLRNSVMVGLSLGIAGLLGDLAESMIKRDCERKDASQVVPGFGGILDVVDAILFAAPVAYWWFGPLE